MWIAKDRSGDVYLYKFKPYKDIEDGEWAGDDLLDITIFSECAEFKDIIDKMSWTDTEPVEICKISKLRSLEEIKKLSEDYEKSINDPDCPFYTPEDIKKAFIEGIKLFQEYVDSKR